EPPHVDTFALEDVAPTAYYSVVCIEHGCEKARVDVVESGPSLADESFGDERAEKQREFSFALGDRHLCRPRGPRQRHAVARLDLRQELPEQHRDAHRIDETENRVIVRAFERVPLA